jgi:death on curing protein
VKGPIFLNREIVERLHGLVIERFGGTTGTRDSGLIESAVAAALNDSLYRQADLFGIAAAYAFHLAQAQAFLDGNKRTAVAAALVFLELNKIRKTPSDQEIYDSLIAIAERRLDKVGLAALFRQAAS